MAMIEFVRNYTDRSTDRGYQFEFHCDHCSNGYMSSYQPSVIGTAGGLLQAAGSIFGGFLGSAGNSTYEIQRAIGGPAHDRALQQAVTEVKQKFRRCQRCGNWVCAEICWNEPAAQCTGCTPKYEQEVISLRTHAQVQATQQQLQDKAATTDYVSGIDMRPDAEVSLHPGAHDPGATTSELPRPTGSFLPASWQTDPSAALTPPATSPQWSPVEAPAQSASTCTACGAPLHGSKFCPGCGTRASAPAERTCAACGHLSPPSARFCEDCGAKLG